MRICISSLSLDTFGGAERVVVSDAEHFAHAGHDVHLIADAFDPEVLSSYGLSDSVDTHWLSLSQHGPVPQMFSRAAEIRRLLLAIEPDAVIVHYHEKATWLALATLDIDPTFVAHVHGSLFWFQDNTRRAAHMWKRCAKELVEEVPGHSEFWTVDTVPLGQKLYKFGAESLETLALRSCDEVFVNTHQVARELRCLYGVEARVNPPGIDEERFPVSTDGDLDIEPPFVFSLSRLDPRKRLDLLVAAFAEFQESHSEFQLAIGGTGEHESELQSLAADLGISDAVTFLGHVDEGTLPTYYAEADVFACPGWMSYGLTPLEAVRSGTRVALSTDAFVKEVIGDQPGVEVIDPDVESWVSGLDRLVECDGRPSSAGLPTVESHADAKLAALDT
jgi:glycosyltransferase involved in cell wall biosynthesis